MCRFVGYLGLNPITLARIVAAPSNSLISQSQHALLGKRGLNADGFGIAWYNQSVDPTAAVFKSIQPAWNDQNLRHIAAKVQSNCFIGHVRASTVGNVDTPNCHPFSFDNLSFAHNGTIRNFAAIKRELLRTLNDNSYFSIHGETDSEHFFALFHNILHTEFKHFGVNEMEEALFKAIKTINALQKEIGKNDYCSLNTVLTDGRNLIATRYHSSEEAPKNTLFYSVGDYILPETGKGLMNNPKPDQAGAFIVASEPINEVDSEWIEIKQNQMIIVDSNINITIRNIDV